MKVYVAAPWSCREEARSAADYLAGQGFTIVSRWLREHEDSTSLEELRREAQNDVADLRECSALVLLNLGKSDGKATELGMAYAWAKHIVVVGDRQGNVFYNLPEVTIVPTMHNAAAFLRGCALGASRRWIPAR